MIRSRDTEGYNLGDVLLLRPVEVNSKPADPAGLPEEPGLLGLLKISPCQPAFKDPGTARLPLNFNLVQVP